MEIQLQQQTINGEFFIEDEQKIKLAYLTFIMDNATEMRINHTVVSEVLRGQGIARKLVDNAVQYARDKGYKIIPECTYTLSVFQKTPEYANIWEK